MVPSRFPRTNPEQGKSWDCSPRAICMDSPPGPNSVDDDRTRVSLTRVVRASQRFARPGTGVFMKKY
jgi:hypothetical protein